MEAGHARLGQAPRAGATRSARREAADRARAHMYAWTQLTPVSGDTDRGLAGDLLGYARQATEVRARHGVLLSRVTQVDRAVERFLDALHWYEEAVVADNPGTEDVRAATRFYLLPIGEAAVRLCEGCAELLFDARLLSPWGRSVGECRQRSITRSAGHVRRGQAASDGGTATAGRAEGCVWPSARWVHVSATWRSSIRAAVCVCR